MLSRFYSLNKWIYWIKVNYILISDDNNYDNNNDRDNDDNDDDDDDDDDDDIKDNEIIMLIWRQ